MNLGLAITFDSPLAAALSVLCIAGAIVVWRRWRDAGLSIGALAIAMATLCMLLAGPALVLRGQQSPIVAIVDISASYRSTLDDGRWTQIRQQLIDVLASDGRPTVTVFSDGEARLIVRAEPGERPRLPDELPETVNPFATRPFAAASEVVEPAGVQRVIVVSDGAFDREQLATSFPRAAFYSLDAALPDRVIDAARIESLGLPTEVSPGTPPELRVTWISAGTEPALEIRRLGSAGETIRRALESSGGAVSQTLVQVPAEWFAQPGLVQVEATISATGADELPFNNRALAATTVAGPPVILLLQGQGTPDLRHLLEESGAIVKQRAYGRSAVVASELVGADLVVLVDLPVSQLPMLPDRFQGLVGRAGVPVLAVGAGQAFAAGGYAGTGLELALPVLSDPESSPRHHVLLLDASASMAEREAQAVRWDILRTAVGPYFDRLGPGDRMMAIPFAGVPREDRDWLVMDAQGREAASQQLASVRPDGATSVLQALRAAAQAVGGLAAPGPEGPWPQVVLVSDGESPGDPLEDFAEPTAVLWGAGARLTLVLLSDRVPEWAERVTEQMGEGRVELLRVGEIGRLRSQLEEWQRERVRKSLIQDAAQALVNASGKPWDQLMSEFAAPLRTKVGLKLVGEVQATSEVPGEGPLSAVWRYGRGAAAAIAADPSALTATPEGQALLLAHVAWLLEQAPSKSFSAEFQPRLDGVELRLTDVRHDDPLIQEVEITAFLWDSSSGSESRVEFTRTGPRDWTAELIALPASACALVIEANGEQMIRDRIPLAPPIPAEYRPQMDSPMLLRAMVSASGGEVLAQDAKRFSRKLPPTEAEQRRLDWALIIMLVGALSAAVLTRRRGA